MATEQAVILKYKVDRGSVTQVVASNDQVKASLGTVSKEAAKAGADIRAAFQSRSTTTLSKAMETATASIRDAREESDDLRDSLNEAARASQNVNVPAPNRRSGAGGNTGGNSLNVADATDTSFSRVSAIVSALPGGSELANVAGLISDVSAGFKELPGVLQSTGLSIGQLVTLGGGAGIALAGLAAIITLVTNAVNQAREAEQRRIELIVEGANRQAELNTLIEQGNTGQVQSLIAQSQQDFEAAQIAFNELQQRAIELEQQRQQVIADYGDTFNVFGFEVQAAIDENAAAQAVQVQAMQDAQVALEDYTAALGPAAANMSDTAQSAQELAAAAAEATAELQRATQAQLTVIRGRVQQELEYTRLANSASSASIQQRIDENNQQVALLRQSEESLRAFAEAGDEVAQQALPEVTAEIQRLNADTQRLSGSILASAQAREQEAQATRDGEQAARQRAQTLSQVADIERQIRDQSANERRADARAERDLRRQRLLEDIDFQKKLAEQEREFNQSQLDAIKEAQEADQEARSDKLDVEKEYAQREIDRTKAFEDRLTDIRNRANEEVGDAAGELDTKRVEAALRAKEKELADAVKQNDKQAQENGKSRDERLAQIEEERKDRQSELAQRLADERKHFQEQRAQQIQEFNQRRQRENEALAIRRQDELQDRQLRLQAQRAQIDDLKASLEQEKNIRRQGYAAMLADARNAFGSLGSGGGKGNIGAGSSGSSTPPPSNGGGSGGGLGSGSGKAPVGGLVSGFNGGGGSSGFNGGFNGTLNSNVRGFAGGGNPPLNVPVKIGEKGTELAVFTQPTTIYPNSQMNKFAGGSGGPTMYNTFHITGNDPEAIGNIVVQKMDQLLDTAASMQ